MNPLFRSMIKSVLGETLWLFPTSQLARLKVRGGIGLVLTFHYFGAPVLPGLSEDLFLSRQKFAKILDFIASDLCPLEPFEFLKRLSEGTLPPRATMLTFDDGTRECVTEVLPEMVKRGLKACFFVCPGLIRDCRPVPSIELMNLVAAAGPRQFKLEFEGTTLEVDFSGKETLLSDYRRIWAVLRACPSRDQPRFFSVLRKSFGLKEAIPMRYMPATFDELGLLDEAGMTVGNHTMYHSTPAADGTDRFLGDVDEAYAILEARFGQGSRMFCYPYGTKIDATAGTDDGLKARNVQYAFLTQGGLANPGKLDPWNLHREQVSYSASALKLTPLLALFR